METSQNNLIQEIQQKIQEQMEVRNKECIHFHEYTLSNEAAGQVKALNWVLKIIKEQKEG